MQSYSATEIRFYCATAATLLLLASPLPVAAQPASGAPASAMSRIEIAAAPAVSVAPASSAPAVAASPASPPVMAAAPIAASPEPTAPAAAAPAAPVKTVVPGAPAADTPSATAPAAGDSAATAPVKPAPPPPTLYARINLTNQTLTVSANGKTIHTWKVSSGAPGYATPPGTFKPGWMAKMWYSRQYDSAPMPHSVFFNGGIAVHGTQSLGSLGRAASHGCVRLAPGNAAKFYALVSRHGLAQTRVIVHGRQPFSTQQHIAAKERARLAKANRGNRGHRSYANLPTSNSHSTYTWPGSNAYAYPGRVPVARSSQAYWTRY